MIRTMTRSALAMLAVAMICGAAVLAGVSAASAQERLPGGSWRETCNGGRVHHGVLSASCLTRDGHVRFSRLDLRDCRSEVRNLDGRLVCREARRPRMRMPPGSWQETCTRAEIRGSVLSASCRTRDGRMRFSALDLRGCHAGVVNLDGRLVCHRAPQPGWSLPSGSWRETCTSYRFNGTTLTALCRTRDGGMRRSQIWVRSCPAGVVNINGRLACGR